MTEADSDGGSGSGARSGQVLLGKYRVERLLGRGGMGEVYEARHVVVGRRFAVKFLKQAATGSSETRARFLREAQAAGALDNEHIAAVVDFDWAADGAPFLVMEYLNGESLAEVLRREGVLPLRRVLGILLQVCDGLAAAHAAGIVHRDLKPGNLFVVARSDAPELVKILDFGVAKLMRAEPDGSNTASGAVLGTPLYMAPEQARGERSVDLRVDIHALGVIAYESLSGQRPHPGDGYNAILAHILTQPVRPLRELCPELPQGLVRAVERALAFEPSDRHESASALAAELLPLAGRAVSSRGAHFDLRSSAHVAASEKTLSTSADARAPADGTLQSAVGDARSLGSSSVGPRRRVWQFMAVAATVAAFWLLAQRTGSVPPSAAVDTASVSMPIAAVPASAAAPSARASASATALEHASAVATASAPAAKPKPAGVTSRPPRSPKKAPRRGSAGGRGAEITFDEQNPY